MDLSKPETGYAKELERESLFERFIGPHASYYILAWSNMKGRWASWNWSAFLFGDAWLFYRKMYLYGVIYSLCRVLLTPLLTAPNFFKTPLDVDLIALLAPHTLLMNVVLGIAGNHLYFRHAKKKIDSASAKHEAHHLLLSIEAMGGVSVVALLLIPLFALIEHLIPFLLDTNISYEWFQSSQTF